MARKALELEEEQIQKFKSLIEEFGYPTSLAGKQISITTSQANKALEQYKITKPNPSSIDVIMSRAFLLEIDRSELKMEMIFSAKLFSYAPDIKFWEAFPFTLFNFTSLRYFLGNGKEAITLRFQVFNHLKAHENLSELSLISKSLYPEFDILGCKSMDYIRSLETLWSYMPNADFWRSFDPSKIFYTKKVFIRYLLEKDNLEKIIKQYKIFSINPEIKKATELTETKFGQDRVIEKKPKTTLEFIERK